MLVDEPSIGLTPIMVDKIFEVVRNVAAKGVTNLLVKQNASRGLAIASRAYVMESGHEQHVRGRPRDAQRLKGVRRFSRRAAMNLHAYGRIGVAFVDDENWPWAGAPICVIIAI
jgi:ABC-type polar amino acid transport system ATPase subunit